MTREGKEYAGGLETLFSRPPWDSNIILFRRLAVPGIPFELAENSAQDAELRDALYFCSFIHR